MGLQLSTRIVLERDGGGVIGAFALSAGESATFAIGELGDDRESYHPLTDAESDALFEETVSYWRNWLSQCTYKGRWREMVERSALVLKLLTYEPTGAIVAAPTCSLPEELGGERNWDYRYTWIRDAAFTLYALLRIGFTDEARRFMHWLEAQIDPDDGDWRNIQIMYGIDGRRNLEEFELKHLDGYRGSKPVRIGNGAADQLQLDIYGELMDSVYLFNRYGEPISYDFWTKLRQMTNWVCDNWRLADEGIWETRGGRQHFVYSKLMCWVMLDRAVRLADARAFPSERLQVDGDAQRNLRGDSDEGVERRAAGVRAALRQRFAGRIQPDYAAGVLHGADGPADVEHAGRDQPPAASRGDWCRTAWSIATIRAVFRRFDRAGRHVQHVHVLAGGGADAGQLGRRPATAGPGAADVREDAGLREPPGAVRRGDRAERRGPGQFPAGVHAPGADQLRVQPGPGVGRRAVGYGLSEAKLDRRKAEELNDKIAAGSSTEHA